HVSGAVQDADHYRFSAAVPSLTAGGFTLTGNTLVLTPDGLSLEGDADLPLVDAVHLSGTVTDADHFTLSVPLADVTIGQFTLSDNTVPLSAAGAAITAHAHLAVAGDVTFEGSLTADGFAITATPEPISLLDGLVQFKHEALTLTTEGVTLEAEAAVAQIGDATFEGSLYF